MPKKPSPKRATEAAKEAHSSDPETRKEAMATLRDKRSKPGKSPSSSKSPGGTAAKK